MLFVGFGFWISNFTQMIPGLEGNFISFIYSRQFSWIKYLKTWYALFLIHGIVNFTILLFGISIFHDISFFVFLAIFLYTVGFGAFLMFVGILFNKGKINPNRMVYKWVSKNNGSLMQILFIIAYIIPFTFRKGSFFIISLSVLGVLFIFTHHFWISWIAKKLESSKYELIMNFLK
jgi:hypothetical protein